MRWLGDLECWGTDEKSKKFKKTLSLILHAVIWGIWGDRNDKKFNGKVNKVEDIVKAIKVLTWHWTMSRMKIIASCLFYEGC